MKATEIDVLRAAINELKIDANETQIQALIKHLEEIELWNPKMGIVNSEGRELVIRHTIDSLSALHILREYNPTTAADIGSGGGFPGIPLAIFMEQTQFDLIERSDKKAGFLRNATSLCGLSKRVKVECKNIDEIQTQYDMLVFRAFSSIDKYLKDFLKILAPGGVIAAYKGKLEVIEEEVRNINKLEIANTLDIIVKQVKNPRLPHEERHLVLIKRNP